MLASFAVACNSGEDNKGNANATTTAASTTAAPEGDGAKKPVLKMGTNAEFPPYEYYDDVTGEIVGIDVEIAKAICAKMGKELEIVDMQFDSIIAAVVSGKVDFGMSGFTVTEERKQNVDFSTSYTTAKQSVLVPAETAITTVDDLLNVENEYKIGVQIGTTGDLYITGDVEAMGLKHSVERFNKYGDAVMALLSGKLDCMIVDDQVALSFAAANDGLALLDTAYALEEYAICFPKESELYASFNAALEELIADGTVQTIISKYISAE
jgi:polar amino acid transport system substrate-binding protein